MNPEEHRGSLELIFINTTINNYWMRLSIISRIFHVIKAEADNIDRGLNISWYHAKAKSNNCFIIHLKTSETCETYLKPIWKQFCALSDARWNSSKIFFISPPMEISDHAWLHWTLSCFYKKEEMVACWYGFIFSWWKQYFSYSYIFHSWKLKFISWNVLQKLDWFSSISLQPK